MKHHLGQAGRFVVVGTVAAAVHLLVVKVLVQWLGLMPLVANLGGWMVAFWASFLGHYRWTFKGGSQGTALAPATSAKRFFLVSAVGFVVNEALYAAALRWSAWRFDWLLAGVLIVMALLTFLASRLWAFRGSGHSA
jgi:putative flippase GtrA